LGIGAEAGAEVIVYKLDVQRAGEIGKTKPQSQAAE
jgi:hypothetical protein